MNPKGYGFSTSGEPFGSKYGLREKQGLTSGWFLCILSFVVSCILFLKINDGEPG